MTQTERPSTHPCHHYRTWRHLYDIEHRNGGGEYLADLLESLTDHVVWQQDQIDALTAKLYGSSDAGYTDGDIPGLRGDVLELMRDAITRVVGPGRSHTTSDEQATYHAPT